MKYIVVKGFFDKKDKEKGAAKGFHYTKESEYPREGKEPKEKRVAELIEGGFIELIEE